MTNKGSSDKIKPSAKNPTKSTFLAPSQKAGWWEERVESLPRKSNLIIKYQFFFYHKN